jgi:hypothetical protein
VIDALCPPSTRHGASVSQAPRQAGGGGGGGGGRRAAAPQQLRTVGAADCGAFAYDVCGVAWRRYVFLRVRVEIIGALIYSGRNVGESQYVVRIPVLLAHGTGRDTNAWAGCAMGFRTPAPGGGAG